MENIFTVIILLAVVTALAQMTDKIRVPYPILLVLAGMLIGFVPGLPHIELDPDLVFLIFLPPVLYAAAWTTSWPEFKAARRSISLLAIGCVLFTTTMVAVVAYYWIPEFGWAEAFVLGAIISPPDAVAATAATQGLNLPKRVITILEGESLVNDATGLIAYRYAIATTATGTFIFWLATINFFYVAGVGILIGLAIGYLFYWIHRMTPDNPTADTTLTFLAPYTSYLVAEHFHTSGVLSVVTCGLFLSWFSSEIINHESRLQAQFVWSTVIFLLNGLIFILIGLQLPVVLDNIKEHSLWSLLWYGFLVSLATIVVRILWVFPGAYLPRWVSRKIRENEPDTNPRLVTVVAWSGMRGIVSLAAALALPLMSGDKPFPNRDLIIFLTFCVIFATLVLQGLTLRPLIRWLGIKADEREMRHEQDVRMHIASTIIEHIEENYALTLTDKVLGQVKAKYEIQIQRLRKDDTAARLSPEQIREFLNVQRDLVATERRLLITLKKQGRINDEAMRKIEHELDLEESRLLLELE
ncbi:MAG: Na+/H+ antiporter [Cyclobacteriaceae bacterium]|nr:Na+/H+ antiporter [Cyclobacteriaceae bacterium]